MNIISHRSIEIAAKVAADPIRRPDVKAWMVRSMQRHIRKTPALMERVRMKFMLDSELDRNEHGKNWKPPKNLKQRLHEAFDRGEDLFVFVDTGPLYSALLSDARSVGDWLDAIPEWDRHLKRIDRISYAEASRMAASWHARLMKLAADADDPDVVEEAEVVQEFEDGCRIVELKGPVALFREGALMGHCVGGLAYVDAVRSGRARIFSLRDETNMPHATIEVRNGYKSERIYASQIKGKGNRPPVEHWAAYVRPFVVANKWIVEYDGNNIGLFTIAGRTYENPDEILNAVLDGIPSAEMAARRMGTLSNLLGSAMGIQQILLRRMAEISAQTRKRLFGTLAPTAGDVVTQNEENILCGPGGEIVGRRRLVVPGAFFQALSLGFFANMEDAVVASATPLLDDLLARISSEPCHIWTISVKGQPDGRAFLQQIAAYAGRSKNLQDVADLVKSSRSSAIGRLSAAIRRQASLGERGAAPPEGGWAHQLAMIERLKPEAIARIDSPISYLM